MKHQKWHDGIKKYCAKLIKDFKNKVVQVKWRERSILLSEGFAFCVISEMRQADVIIESGIYNGRSTEIWAKYFKDKKIIVIDKAIDWKKIEHLKKYSNIEYMDAL